MAFGDGGFDDWHWAIIVFVFGSCWYFIDSMINEWIIKDHFIGIPISLIITAILFYLFRNFVEFTNPRDKKLKK